MEHVQVWCWVVDADARVAVTAALARAPVEVVVVDEVGHLDFILDRPDAVCLVAGSQCTSDLGTLTGLCFNRPARSTVLVHAGPEPPPVLLGRVVPVVADRLAHDLRRAVVVAFMALQAERIREQVREARHLHLRVRDAIRIVLDVNPALEWDVPPRSFREVTTVANELRVDRPELSRLLSQARLPFGAVSDEWLVTWAIGLNRLAGDSWKSVRGRLGYGGPSGLTGLFQRSVGSPPTATTLSLPRAVERFDRMMQGWLRGEGSG